MRRSRLPLGLDYLDNRAGIHIAGTGLRSSDSVLDTLFVAAKNTLAVTAAGIALALLIGVLIGIARLSTNWLVRRAAGVYVEAIRNVPLLAIIFFWSAAVILKLPRITAPTEAGGFVLSNRGLWVPWFIGHDRFRTFVGALVVASVVAVGVAIWRTRYSDRTGRPHRRVAWATLVVFAVGIVAYIVLDAPISGSVPQRVGRTITGGITVQPSYAALLAGLVVYTASHIAEIVRGSIQAVPRGQTEAATAIGLGPAQRLRFVVLPQALRVALPQLANQFLNLAKNSSLGIAVAYPELMTVTQINVANGAPAPQSFAVLMLFYLVMSLTIAAGTNLLNHRLMRTSR